MSNSIRHGYETRELPDYEPSQVKTKEEAGIEDLSRSMKAKLDQKAREGRHGWHDKRLCSAEDLSRMLREHVEKGDPVDVANFCMMLHWRGERIT